MEPIALMHLDDEAFVVFLLNIFETRGAFCIVHKGFSTVITEESKEFNRLQYWNNYAAVKCVKEPIIIISTLQARL